MLLMRLVRRMLFIHHLRPYGPSGVLLSLHEALFRVHCAPISALVRGHLWNPGVSVLFPNEKVQFFFPGRLFPCPFGFSVGAFFCLSEMSGGGFVEGGGCSGGVGV